MAATVEATRVIEPDPIYPVPVAGEILGWGAHAWRQARKNGLEVLYTAGHAYVRGSTLIDYIEANSKRLQAK